MDGVWKILGTNTGEMVIYFGRDDNQHHEGVAIILGKCLIVCSAGDLFGRAICSRNRHAETSSHIPQGLLFLVSPIFHCHKIKDGGYNNITNTNKVSPTQNTPALQAKCLMEWKPVNSRLINIRGRWKQINMTITQYYTPTNNNDKEAKRHFMTCCKPS